MAVKTYLLRDARRRKKLTQVELAARSGVDQQTISRIELEGEYANPTIRTILALSLGLDMNPYQLRFGPAEEDVVAK